MYLKCSLQTSKRFLINTKLKSQVLQNHKYMLHETYLKEVHGRFLLGHVGKNTFPHHVEHVV